MGRPLDGDPAQPLDPGWSSGPGAPGFHPFPREALETSLAACFETQVAARPDAIALLDSRVRLTCESLNRRANRVAWEILGALGAA